MKGHDQVVAALEAQLALIAQVGEATYLAQQIRGDRT